MKGEEVVKMLLKKGWKEIRIKGSHHIMKSPDGKTTVSIPCHNTDLHKGILNDILKDAGLK